MARSVRNPTIPWMPKESRGSRGTWKRSALEKLPDPLWRSRFLRSLIGRTPKKNETYHWSPVGFHFSRDFWGGAFYKRKFWDNQIVAPMDVIFQVFLSILPPSLERVRMKLGHTANLWPFSWEEDDSAVDLGYTAYIEDTLRDLKPCISIDMQVRIVLYKYHHGWQWVRIGMPTNDHQCLQFEYCTFSLIELWNWTARSTAPTSTKVWRPTWRRSEV